MRIQSKKYNQTIVIKKKKDSGYKKMFIGLIIFILLVGLVSKQLLNFSTAKNMVSHAEIQNMTVTPKPELISPELKKLRTEIYSLIEDYQTKDLDNASIVISSSSMIGKIDINGDKQYLSASLYKLFVLWELQREINQGVFKDDTELTFTKDNDRSDDDGGYIGNYGDTFPISRLRELMIEESNNTAATMIVEQITFLKIENMIKDFGFKNTKLSGGQYTTADDIYKLFNGIENRNLDPMLTTKDYDLMAELLKNQKINNALNEGFDKNIIFAHKTANLDTVVHDAGFIILPNNQSVTISVMTEGTNFASYGFLYKLGMLINDELT